MRTPTILAAVTAALTTGFVLLSACVDAISAGTEPPPSPALASPDSGAPPAPDAGMCISYDCPSPYATCAGKRGLCNSNLDTDIDNCGACGAKCTSGDAGGNLTKLYCVAGKCRLECESGYGDCNGDITDACESIFDNDPKNCGACGNACKDGEICWHAACGCPPGYEACGDSCTQLDRDPANCSACGAACSIPPEDAGATVWPCGPGVLPPKIGPVCWTSSCKLDCTEGFGDCNDDHCGDGCETDLKTDPKNCGGCGITCLPEQGCINGKCQCENPALALCGTCVNLQKDPGNCGACGNVCPGRQDLSGGPTCVLGRCSFLCRPGHADCDQRVDNGCEVDTSVDPLNCGGCGVHCELDGGALGVQPCAGGQCLTKPCPFDAGGPN